MVMLIGLTGGIGAGKSTVAQLFEERGVPIVDADAIARDVVKPGQPALAELVEYFGDTILGADGELNRGRLAEVAFADAESHEALNAIMHPAISAETSKRIDALRGEHSVIVHDVPLLVEAGLAGNYDLTVLVDTPAEVRMQRLTELRGMDPEDAKKRIAAQATDEQRRAVCDVALDNSGDIEHLRAQFEQMWERFISRE
ncbi:dephospho-CoA kinase [Brevibacterium sp. UMB1308A]|uniref:dephospho-CoA kinase n=1 Tax=Brevibacterium sp. UMB1308A TaxID=3050608 RepID=UPI00254A34D2|nr:dephospho-CoA kinase [Brevibacterium sp. UMB1308A]MDK8345302.1 dephospho-CoA kinase [Brevibacterium sp. UMB1308B]MDK8713709.1 dephospho-CoA kinase [Brevibacterium sp. UMB1308A]